jgi:DNA-binding ferritin-like protein
MLHELAKANERATHTVGAALSTAQAAKDEATASLLADRLAYREKQLSVMKSMTT